MQLCMQFFVNKKIMAKTIQQLWDYTLSLLFTGGETKDHRHCYRMQLKWTMGLCRNLVVTSRFQEHIGACSLKYEQRGTFAISESGENYLRVF